MLKNGLLGTALIAMLFSANVSAETSEVTYKGTRLGVSEAAFIKQHTNDGFVCSDAPSPNTGRWCRSIVATYGGIHSDTTAIFINNKLIALSIAIPNSDNLVTQIANEASIVTQLEHQYGKADETEWPDESKQGAEFWKKVWHKKNGSSVEYLHAKLSLNNGTMFSETMNVFLYSKEAAKSYQKSDM